MRGRSVSGPIRFWHAFNRHRLNQAALFGFAAIVLLSVLAPALPLPDPGSISYDEIMLSPSTHHFFGTDQLGRDVASRVVYGARASLLVGFIAAGISATLGIVIGSLAGYYGGMVDNVSMRIADVLLSLPTFILTIIIIALLGSSIWNIMALIGLTLWPGTARLIRAEFLSHKERDYVQAALCVGATDSHIMFRQILPNAIHPAIVNTSLQVAGAILIEASLSFLGLFDPDHISWGWMLNDALTYFRRAWWSVVFPGLAITVTVILLNLIGDGLGDALNPRLRLRTM